MMMPCDSRAMTTSADPITLCQVEDEETSTPSFFYNQLCSPQLIPRLKPNPIA